MNQIKRILKNFFSRVRSSIGKKQVEFSEVELIRTMFLKSKAGVMVDVGAHFGESFRPFCEMGWKVLAFEPDSNPKKQYSIRNQLNTESLIFTCALSDSAAKQITFYRSEISTGISGLIPFHDSHQGNLTVDTDTLKAVLEREKIDRVDFLKIDTEGNDLLVLKGLDWCLRPDIILCEFEDEKTKLVGYDYMDLGNYLLSAGYEVYMSEWFPIVKYGSNHKWRTMRKFPCDLSDEKSWGNFIAILPNKMQDFQRAALLLKLRHPDR
jgi:FkbM family methyltransferase